MNSWCTRALVLFAAFAILLPALAPQAAFAQFPSFTQDLVQCGRSGTVQECPGPDGTVYRIQDECTVCDFVALGQRIINFLIFLGVVGATILFVYAGLLYMTAQGNSGQVSRAHSVFRNVLIGLVIILAGWLIVDVVMKTLYGEQGKWGPWNEIVCSNTQDLSGCQNYDPTQGGGQTGGGGTGTGGGCVNCTSLGSGLTTNGRACAGGDNDANCQLNSQLNDDLVLLNGQEPFIVTELNSLPTCSATQSTGCHRNNCHALGTCADVDTGSTVDNANLFIASEVATPNARLEYETQNDLQAREFAQALSNNQAPANPYRNQDPAQIEQDLRDSGQLLVLGNHISGDHFSVYCSAGGVRDHDCDGAPSQN